MAPYAVGSIQVKQHPARRPTRPPSSPQTIELQKGHTRKPGSRPFPCAITLHQDAILELRDGTKIRADIYRPQSGEKVPAIVMWGPYGKSGSGILNLHTFSQRAGVPENILSGYESFEGLDPAEWVPRGYAIVNIDPRGVGDSEGDILFWGTAEGRDGYDAIEELAKLSWCNGKISMAGNSWLAMAQYFIAAEQPPHLICIAPLEGSADPVRELFLRGGIPNLSFQQAISHMLEGRQDIEDVTAMFEQSDMSNEYFEDKRANISKIQVPAYIGGSYSTTIHTIGSLRAFEEISHRNKWLIVHGTQEWYDLYTKERTEDLCKFFDHYLKELPTDWAQTPPVRLALLNYTTPALTNQPLPDLPWHLQTANMRRLYFSPEKELCQNSSSTVQALSYHSAAPTVPGDELRHELRFTIKFTSRTVIVGPSTLIVHIASPDNNEIDLYTQLRKADKDDNLLYHRNIPPWANKGSIAVPDNSVFRYLGPQGVLRASRRDIASALSGKTWKTLSNAKREQVAPGEKIRLEVQLWPTGIVFEEDESLVLRISGHDMGKTDLPELEGRSKNANKGDHVVYVGGSFDSHLQYCTLDP